MIELVNACKALPCFDTFQIVHFPHGSPPLRRADWSEETNILSSLEQQKRALREQVNNMKDWAIDCFKVDMGCQEGEGRKKTTLRVIELNASGTILKFCLDSANVEECEVFESDT